MASVFSCAPTCFSWSCANVTASVEVAKTALVAVALVDILLMPAKRASICSLTDLRSASLSDSSLYSRARSSNSLSKFERE